MPMGICFFFNCKMCVFFHDVCMPGTVTVVCRTRFVYMTAGYLLCVVLKNDALIFMQFLFTCLFIFEVYLAVFVFSLSFCK